MAVSTSSYFSKAIVGVPRVGGDVDIYDTHENPKFAVGTKFERADGACFRYCHFGAVTSAGCLVGTDLSESSLAYAANAVVKSHSGLQQNDETPGLYPGAKGSKYIPAKTTATKNQYAGGTLTVALGSGAGYSYLLVGNTSTGVVSSGVALLEASVPILTAIETTSSIIISGSLYANLEGAISSDNNIPAGVTMANVNTAGYFGWIMTKGITGIILDAFVVNTGTLVTVSTTAGYVSSMAKLSTTAVSSIGATPIVGICVSNGSASAMVSVNVMLE